MILNFCFYDFEFLLFGKQLLNKIVQIQCELFCLRRIKTPAVLDVQRLFRPDAHRKRGVGNVPVKLISDFFGRCYVYMNIISQKIFPVNMNSK